MKIDPQTGLLALPEGHYWDVRELSVCIRSVGVWSEWRQDPENTAVRRRSDGTWGLQIYGLYTHYSRDVDVEVRRGTRSVRKFWSGRSVEQVREYRYRRPYAVEGSKYAEPVTKENLAERCAKLLEEYERKKENAKLYGTYPPKKFGE